MGLGTAWGGRLPCKEDNRWVRFPQGPPAYTYLNLWVKDLLGQKSSKVEL